MSTKLLTRKGALNSEELCLHRLGPSLLIALLHRIAFTRPIPGRTYRTTVAN